MFLDFITRSSSSTHDGGRVGLFICVLSQLLWDAASAFVEFHCNRTRIFRFFLAIITGEPSSCEPNPSKTSTITVDPPPRSRCCSTCLQFEGRQSFDGVLVTADDMARVLKKLGLAWDEAEQLEDYEAEVDRDNFICQDCRIRVAAVTLLEEKEAGEEELRDAFGVFDANRDGYITPTELWMVMRRLEFRDGMMLEECRRMVDAFDQDGDGRISFAEFRRLLETAC